LERKKEVKMYKQKKTIRIDDDATIEWGKIPPQADDLEVSILGAILIRASCIDEIVDFFRPDMMYKESHKVILEAMYMLYNLSNPITVITVNTELKRTGNLEKAGGTYYLTTLCNKADFNVEYNARIVFQKYTQRELILMSAGIIKESYQENADAFEMLEKGQTMIDNVTKSIHVGKFDNITDLFFESEKRNLEIRIKQGISGVPSGYFDIDAVTGGWQNSDLIILAARPGMGKTAFVLNIARNAAVDFREPVAFFSLEMSSMQLMNRLQAAESEISLEKFMRIGLTDEEVQLKRLKCQRLVDSKIYIDDTPALSLFEFKVKLKKLKRDHDIKLAVVDYIQLMTAGKIDNINGREQEIAYISRGLKGVAKELNIPIIALSQLSRKVEERADRTPILSDLRESGSIEQDADMVTFLFRPEYHGILEDKDGNSTVGKAQFIIAKHRNGATTNDIILGWDGQYTKFKDINEPIITQSNKLPQSDEF
jgi:replicative DNA helicase